MNQTVSNVEKEINSKELYKVKDFIGRGSWNKEAIFGRKKWVDSCKLTFLQEMAGFYQADDLTSTTKVIPD